MNSKQLMVSSKVTELTFMKPTIIHFIPDFGSSTLEMLLTSGLDLHNCFSVITKNKIVKLGTKSFNGRQLFIQSKKIIEEKSINVNIYPTVPKIIPQNRYLILDHSLISQATQYICELTGIKRALTFLFQQLLIEFKSIKSQFPEYENIIVFGINDTNSITDIDGSDSDSESKSYSLYSILQRLISISQDDLDLNFRTFDRFAIVSVKLTDKSLLFPIIGFDKKGKTVIYNANIQFIKHIQKEFLSIKDDINGIKKIKELSTDAEAQTELTKNIKTVGVDTSIEIKNDNTIQQKIEVNQTQLRKILRKYKIKDKTIGDNIKSSLDNYIASNEKFNENDLEEQIFKAIHLSIFGTSVISDDYKTNPAKLISKLEEVNTYSKDIEIKNLKENYLLNPADIVSLNRVTGLVRQEYEFSENIHKNIKTLFDSLQNRKDHPIKITSFKHKYQDDNLNRVINYEITLKNISGGFDQPYVVNVKVPALVNDRYFKLNGKQYILANQQFFAPITKTDPNECRLLTSFAMMTLSVENLKFNISELEKIIEYIEIKYPKIITSIVRDKNRITEVKFNNGININLNQSPFYTDVFCQLVSKDGQYYVEYFDEQTEAQPLGKGISEFIYNKLLLTIQAINPNETLNKSTKSIPYIQMYVSGIKVPVIIYFWQQLGLINGLVKLNLDHEIINKNQTTKFNSTSSLHFPLKEDKTLVIHIQNRRQELLANGLLLIDKRKFGFFEEELKNPEAIIDFILSKNGTRSIYQLNNATEKIIDPITKDILEFQDKPTNMINLISDQMIDKLLNDKPDSLTDLKIYRSRQAEIMFNLLYSELMMAHSTYKNNLDQNDVNAKIFLKPNYVIDCLLGVDPNLRGSAVVEPIQAYTPIDELKLATKLIKTGPQGIPNKRSFKKEHRNTHPSYYGNIG